MESLEEKIKRVLQDEISVVPYNPAWPELFEKERRHLFTVLPGDLIKRIEHFGSTAVPGLTAKPIIDILVEVGSLYECKLRIKPILENLGYDYFWRPTFGDDIPPFYAWFIKRDKNGRRSCHIHMVEDDFEHWDRLLFRDYLIAHPDMAEQYSNLKLELAGKHRQDRIAYTRAKNDFISRITAEAKRFYGKESNTSSSPGN